MFYSSESSVSNAREGDALQKGGSQSIKDTTSTRHRLLYLIFITHLVCSHLGDVVQ